MNRADEDRTDQLNSSLLFAVILEICDLAEEKNIFSDECSELSNQTFMATLQLLDI